MEEGGSKVLRFEKGGAKAPGKRGGKPRVNRYSQYRKALCDALVFDKLSNPSVIYIGGEAMSSGFGKSCFANHIFTDQNEDCMSQIFYEPIDLSDLAMSASCIVIGTIESRDQREHAFEDISPFSFTVYRIRVEKVLKGPLSEGELIDVEGANTQAELSMHELYEREDILESPIYLQYNKDRTPKHAIFFFNDGLLVPFAFAAEGAWEEVDNVGQVRALV